MAAQTNRTITLTLNAQTNGSDSVRDLAAEIEKLGRKGGDAAPEFQALSKELNDLANRKDTVQTFEELSAAVIASKIALTEAKVAARDELTTLTALKQTLDANKVSEEAYAVSVRKATEDKREASVANRVAKAELDKFVASIGGAKRVTDDNRAAYNGLTQAVRDTKAAFSAAGVELVKLSPKYETLKKATSEAADAVKKQEAAFNTVNTVLDTTRTEYTGLNDALAKTSTQMNKLGIDTNDLAGANNKLTQSMVKLEAEANQLKTALANPGQAALTTAQKLEQAFGVIGVKSIKATQAEIAKVNNALIHIANDASVTGAEFDRAFSAGKGKVAALESELKKAEAASKGFGGEFGSALKQFGPATLVFNGVSAAINGIFAAGQKLPQVVAEFQTMERTLRILTGSTEEARKEMKYISDVSNRVGIDIKSTADSYIKLTAATKDTNLAGAQTRRIFEAVSGAMGTLGASSSEAENAMSAVTQMVSKGVVSMEEMRQQLSERLPGAFQATSKELGITTAELTDLISSGKLAASDMLPALAAGLEKVYDTGAKNDTLVGKWNEFINAIKQSGKAVGETGMLDTLLSWGRVGGAAVQGLGEDFVLLGKAMGKLSAAAIGPNGSLKEAWAELGQDLNDVNKRIADTAGLTPKTTKSVADLAKEAQKAGQEFFTMADGTKIATATVLNANNGFIQFSVASQKAFDSAEIFSSSARKVAETTRAAGEASITAANAIGDETDKRRTATTVAENNAAAIKNLVAKEQDVIAVLEKEALVRAEGIKTGDAATDGHVKQLVALGEDILKRKTANEGLARQAEAQRVLAEALKIETETLKDNSDKREKLTETNNEYVRVLEILRAAVADGKLSQEQLNVVEEEARKNKRLLVDAIQDQIGKINALRDANAADLDVTRAGVNLAIAREKTYYEVAKAQGREGDASRSLIAIKRLEIKLSELTAQAKRAEADASVLVAQAKIQELRTTGEMTAQKKAEIRVLEAGVKVKKAEADIAAEVAKRTRELSAEFERSGGSANNAADGNNRVADSLDRVSSSASSARDSVMSYQQMVAKGMSQSEIQDRLSDQNTNDTEKSAGIVKRNVTTDTIDWRTEALRKGATAEQADAVAQSIGDKIAVEMDQVRQSYMGATSADPVSYRYAINGAYEQAFTAAMQEAQNPAEKAAAPSTATTLNINIAGRSNAVNVASQQDADALTSILKQIETAAGRAY